MWYHQSKIGLIRIYQNTNRRYSLEIDDELYGSYHSPKAAADSVANFSTGCDEWDKLSSKITPPSDLSEWNQMN